MVWICRTVRGFLVHDASFKHEAMNNRQVARFLLFCNPLFRADGAGGARDGCRTAASGTMADCSRASPDAAKQSPTMPSTSRSGSETTAESSSDRQALRGRIFTVHDRQRRKNKAAVVPVASGGPGVHTAPPISSFISQETNTTVVGTIKHASGEDVTQCSRNNARKSSIPVKVNVRQKKLDGQTHTSSSSKDAIGSQASPIPAVSPLPYKVVTVSPAPESQQANLSNASETKLEQIEKHGRLTQLNFPSIVGHKQPGNGPMELWATRNPSNWIQAKEREVFDTQLHNVKPLHVAEEVEGGSGGLEGERPGGSGLRVVSACGGGSVESPGTTEETRTAHHMLDISDAYDRDSFEDVSALKIWKLQSTYVCIYSCIWLSKRLSLVHCEAQS